MKKLTDEQIQKLVEQQQTDQVEGEAAGDLHMYRLLFDALKEEPEGGLSVNFAGRVAQEAFVQAEQRQNKRYLLLQLLSIGLTLPLLIFVLFIYQPELTHTLISYIYEARWIVVFTILMFTLIQIADYSLVRSQKRISSH